MLVHFEERGPADGPPLLLVHGWPQDRSCWRLVTPRLERDYRCIVPDLRGFGRSPAPSAGYEKERLGDDLLELLDVLGLDRVGYVGHDWGGFVGMLLGLRAPDRLTGLLALSIPHLWPSRRDRLNPLRLAALAYQAPLATPLLGRALMRAGVARLMLPEGVRAGEVSGRVTEAMYRTFLLRELPGIATGRYAHARLTVPTRLVVGEGDPIVRGADLRGFEDHADDMTVERVADAGHFLPEERPDVVAERARELFPVRAGASARA
jgi:pimeloyl-ACP methyl ester carboxylesterase